MKQSAGKMKDLHLRKVILLDNQSTMSLFCNKHMVSNIRKSSDVLTLRSNGGSMQVGHVALINKTTEVWFSPKAITNILSLQDVKRHYRVTYDSYDAAFIVWREEQGLPNMVFKEHNSGLHFYDPKQDAISFVVTVAENMKHFTKRQIVCFSESLVFAVGSNLPRENFRVTRREDLSGRLPAGFNATDISSEEFPGAIESNEHYVTKPRAALVGDLKGSCRFVDLPSHSASERDDLFGLHQPSRIG
jgi:hypothetical protein